MITALALMIAVLGGLAIWAPYAIEQPRLVVFSSTWFKFLTIAVILLWGFILWWAPSKMGLFPWLSALLLLSVVDTHHQSVRVVDLSIMTVFVLPLLHLSSMIHVVVLCSLFFMLLMILKIILQKIYQQNAFGGADIWVILTILAAFGGRSAIVALYAGVILSALVGGIALIRKRKTRRSTLPFIPFLTIGSLFSLFFSEHALTLYQQLIELQ